MEMLDKRLTLAINMLGGGWTDTIMMGLSSKAAWVPVYLLVAVGLIRRYGWKRSLIFIAGAILMVLATDQFCNVVKNVACRIRPCNDSWMTENGLRILSKPTKSFGFFSAHAANSFSLAIYAVKSIKSMPQKLSKGGKATAAAIFLWAAAVSVSRIFVGRHFLGDIVAGALFGLFAGYIFALAAAFVNRRVGVNKPIE